MPRTHRLFDLLQILRRYRHPVSGAYYRWLFFAAGCLEPAYNNWGLMWNRIDKRPEFEAYRDAHINRPARKRAEDGGALHCIPRYNLFD